MAERTDNISEQLRRKGGIRIINTAPRVLALGGIDNEYEPIKQSFSDLYNFFLKIALLFLIIDVLIKNSRTLIVRHHQEKYDGQFPFWVIIELFTS